MKQYEFPLDQTQIHNFFSPIRTKSDIIRLLITTIKYVTNSLPNQTIANSCGSIIIVIKKMCRVFFCREGKIISIQFPFNVIKTGEYIAIYHKNSDFELNSFTTSFFLSVLDRSDKNGIEYLEEFYDIFTEEIDNFGIDPNESCTYWEIFKLMWSFEAGYLRYEFDREHSNGDLHPINHLDICYDSGSSYKLGLKKKILTNEFIDIIDLTTACKYLEF